MKSGLLAGTSILALVTTLSVASAATTTEFDFTGNVVDYTVPLTGVYDIVAAGARGGSNFGLSGTGGARIEGDIFLTAGTVLEIAVGGVGGGHPGSLDGGAGGGGTPHQ